MADEISEQEQEIIDLVTRSLPQNLLTVKPVNVHILEGGESATLRFTMDETSSTDLKRERIASGGESAQRMAQLVLTDLLQQAGGASR